MSDDFDIKFDYASTALAAERYIGGNSVRDKEWHIICSLYTFSSCFAIKIQELELEVKRLSTTNSKQGGER